MRVKEERKFFDTHKDKIINILKKYDVSSSFIDFEGEKRYPVLYIDKIENNDNNPFYNIKRELQELYDEYDKAFYLKVWTTEGIKGKLSHGPTWEQLYINIDKSTKKDEDKIEEDLMKKILSMSISSHKQPHINKDFELSCQLIIQKRFNEITLQDFISFSAELPDKIKEERYKEVQEPLKEVYQMIYDITKLCDINKKGPYNIEKHDWRYKVSSPEKRSAEETEKEVIKGK